MTMGDSITRILSGPTILRRSIVIIIEIPSGLLILAYALFLLVTIAVIGLDLLKAG